jgi:DNA-binding NarL/FixJ family response regulator
LRVQETTGGEQMIAALEEVRPDAVVVDKEIPGTNGLDLVAYIGRAIPQSP